MMTISELLDLLVDSDDQKKEKIEAYLAQLRDGGAVTLETPTRTITISPGTWTGYAVREAYEVTEDYGQR